jgi:hypothetical protein
MMQFLTRKFNLFGVVEIVMCREICIGNKILAYIFVTKFFCREGGRVLKELKKVITF